MFSATLITDLFISSQQNSSSVKQCTADILHTV